MSKKRDWLGLWLAAVTGIALLAAMLLKTFLPRIILPRADAAAIILLSLLALVLDCYLNRGGRRDFRLITLYGVLIFGLFPVAGCYVPPSAMVKMALLGGAVFTVTAFLFDSLLKRLSTGAGAKLAPLITAGGLFLASQCLMGIL